MRWSLTGSTKWGSIPEPMVANVQGCNVVVVGCFINQIVTGSGFTVWLIVYKSRGLACCNCCELSMSMSMSFSCVGRICWGIKRLPRFRFWMTMTRFLQVSLVFTVEKCWFEKTSFATLRRLPKSSSAQKPLLETLWRWHFVKVTVSRKWVPVTTVSRQQRLSVKFSEMS